MKLVAYSLFALNIVLACGQSHENNTATAEVAEVAVADMAATPEPEEAKMANENTTVQNIEQKIIREGHLQFETQEPDNTYNRLVQSAKKYNAYIQEDSEGKSWDRVYRNVTVRIPNTHFDAFIADISTGISFFDQKQITSQDVTEEFVDLNARLKAKKTLEERYLQLLHKAVKVSEIIEIERELSAIREEIEAKEGRLKYLQHRVSYSTITVNFYKKVPQSEQATVSYGNKMWNALQSGWNGISSFFIGVLHVWPFIIILVALFFFIRKRLRTKKI